MVYLWHLVYLYVESSLFNVMLSGSVTESHCAEYHYADGRCDVKPNLTYAI